MRSMPTRTCVENNASSNGTTFMTLIMQGHALPPDGNERGVMRKPLLSEGTPKREVEGERVRRFSNASITPTGFFEAGCCLAYHSTISPVRCSCPHRVPCDTQPSTKRRLADETYKRDIHHHNKSRLCCTRRRHVLHDGDDGVAVDEDRERVSLKRLAPRVECPDGFESSPTHVLSVMPSRVVVKRLVVCGFGGDRRQNSCVVLHWDVMLNNLPVLSLDAVGVTRKSTEFGSSRRHQRVDDKFSFTKAIGTPVYMAPAVLNKPNALSSSHFLKTGLGFSTEKAFFSKGGINFP